MEGIDGGRKGKGKNFSDRAMKEKKSGGWEELGGELCCFYCIMLC